MSSSVGCPIVVEGRLWGALAVHCKQSLPLPPDTDPLREGRVGAVGQVAHARVPDGRHVHPDLVGSPRLEVDVEQGGGPERLDALFVEPVGLTGTSTSGTGTA